MKEWSRLEGTIHREVGTASGSYSVSTKIAEAPEKRLLPSSQTAAPDKTPPPGQRKEGTLKDDVTVS